MPFKMPDLQAKYTLTLSAAELPVGYCERVGCGLWLTVCPLCGMVEIIPANLYHADEYAPPCKVKQTNPAAYRRWLALHPQAADFRRVTLRLQTPNIIPLADAPATVEPNEKAA